VSGSVKVCDRDSGTGAVSTCTDTGLVVLSNVLSWMWIDAAGSKAFIASGNRFYICTVKADGTLEGCVYGTAPANTFRGGGAGGILTAGGG
jgi:hypothetical protein